MVPPLREYLYTNIYICIYGTIIISVFLAGGVAGSGGECDAARVIECAKIGVRGEAMPRPPLAERQSGTTEMTSAQSMMRVMRKTREHTLAMGYGRAVSKAAYNWDLAISRAKSRRANIH